LSNFLDLTNRNVLLKHVKDKNAKTKYSVYVVEFEKNYILLNLTQFSNYLGVSRGKAKIILNNEPFIPNGKEKLYYVSDVAIALWEQRTRC